MQNTIFEPSSLIQILADVVDVAKSSDLLDGAVKSIELQKFIDILEDRKYVTDLEYKILYQSYDQKMSTRQIARGVEFSHSYIASVRSSLIVRLAKICQFFISTREKESLEIDDMVDKDFDYDRFITDALADHSRNSLIRSYARYRKDNLIFDNLSDLSDDQFELAKSKIKRVLGFEGILSRQFIENVKNLAAEEFNVEKIELVGSYRRNEATEESDVDFLILDEDAPYGLKFLKMIAFLKDHLDKEVGLLHKNSMTRERDKEIIESMMEDIEEYE
jgi:hypothetical protein